MKFSGGVLNQFKRGDQHIITVEIVSESNNKNINTISGSRRSTADQARTVNPWLESSITENKKPTYKTNNATHTEIDDQVYNDNYNYETFEERRPISIGAQTSMSNMPTDINLPA